jgi:hypothetical protein
MNIELPENPTRTQVLYAALCASNHSDRLLVEALQWRELSHELFEQVDEMKGKAGSRRPNLERR